MSDVFDWNDALWLLRASPHEFMPGDQTLARLRRVAPRWSDRSELTDEERNRIRAVWVEGVHRPALGLTPSRQNAVRTLR